MLLLPLLRLVLVLLLQVVQLTGLRTVAAYYEVKVTEHASVPVLSSRHGGKGCLTFNPSVVVPSETFGSAGLLVRQCCGASCTGHGQQSVAGGTVHAERISFAKCDLETAECGEVDEKFNLDPSADTEDPRMLYSKYDKHYYLFYYRSPAAPGSGCSGPQCTVQLSRTRTPLNASSYEKISVLPWHRNGCCIIRPRGQLTFCIWGEGGDGGPFPGLGISVTTDIAKGHFSQVPWLENGNSPLSPDRLWLLPLGPGHNEIKLEAGTHMHELSTGDLISFYAAATPGWVAHGNYTAGFIILDGENPARVKQRSREPFLVPTFDYETLCPGKPSCAYHGERHNVIFLCSAVPIEGAQPDTFRLFFGAGDGNVGTAVVTVGHFGSDPTIGAFSHRLYGFRNIVI